MSNFECKYFVEYWKIRIWNFKDLICDVDVTPIMIGWCCHHNIQAYSWSQSFKTDFLKTNFVLKFQHNFNLLHTIDSVVNYSNVPVWNCGLILFLFFKTSNVPTKTHSWKHYYSTLVLYNKIVFDYRCCYCFFLNLKTWDINIYLHHVRVSMPCHSKIV